jgi:hypothetical protein
MGSSGDEEILHISGCAIKPTNSQTIVVFHHI